MRTTFSILILVTTAVLSGPAAFALDDDTRGRQLLSAVEDGDVGGRYGDDSPGYRDRRDLANEDDDWHGADTAMVVMMALLLLLAGGVLWLLRPRRGSPRSDGPLEILARRFAAGEIDQDEHDRRLRALGGTK